MWNLKEWILMMVKIKRKNRDDASFWFDKKRAEIIEMRKIKEFLSNEVKIAHYNSQILRYWDILEKLDIPVYYKDDNLVEVTHETKN